MILDDAPYRDPIEEDQLAQDQVKPKPTASTAGMIAPTTPSTAAPPPQTTTAQQPAPTRSWVAPLSGPGTDVSTRSWVPSLAGPAAPPAPNIDVTTMALPTMANPPAATPAPQAAPATMTSEQWQSYTPTAGKTEAEKLAIMLENAKLAPKQPVGGTDYSQFRATADQSFDANGQVQNVANPAKVAEVEALMKTAGAAGVQEQKDALAATNAGQADVGRAQAVTDATTQANTMPNAGFADAMPMGVTGGNEEFKAGLPTKQQWIDDYLAKAGYGPTSPTPGAPTASVAPSTGAPSSTGVDPAGTRNDAKSPMNGTGGAPGAGPAVGGTVGGVGGAAGPSNTPSGDQNALIESILKLYQQQYGAQAQQQKSREEQIQDLRDTFVSPSRQTSANDVDPFSGVTTIDPNNDLRSTVITNTDDARTADYARRVDDASSALPKDRVGQISALMKDFQNYYGPTDVTAGANIASNPSERLSKLQGLVDSTMGGLAGVDRVQQAKDLWDTLSKEGSDEYDLARMRAGEDASRAGKFFSGGLRTQYGDLELKRERDLDSLKSRLINDALDKSVGDQFNKANTLSGYEGQLSGEEAAQRAEQRGERAYSTDVATGNVNRGLSARQAAATAAERTADSAIADDRNNLSTLSDLENRARASNVEGINALRGERSNQIGQENDAFTRRFAQYQAEQNAKNTRFNQGLSLLGAGETGNPSGTLGALADQMGGADPQAIAALARTMGAGGGGGSASGDVGGSNSLPPEIGSLIESILSKGLPGPSTTPGSMTGATTPAGGINRTAIDKLLGGPELQNLLQTLQPSIMRTTPQNG